jgi:diguanylate cyclase (GGDEF)-like protein/PAS domain S-box-containing protein
LTLIDSLGVAAFAVDSECRVVLWNKACERLTGVAARELIGTRDQWRAFYDERRPCLADLAVTGRHVEVASLFAGLMTRPGDDGCSAEIWRFMPRIGRSFCLAVEASPIRDRFGSVIAAVETLRDVTAEKERQAELERAVGSDWLTGLLNRRGFDELLANEVRRAARANQPLSLLLVDIDFFKRYNDSYGHQNGDECLKRVAHAISAALSRPGDIAARYGGDEFAVVLPDTDLSGALQVAENIRRRVGEVEAPGVSPMAVTLSIGGAAALLPHAHPEGLIACSDAALYLAKREGRNRASVIRYEPCSGSTFDTGAERSRLVV